MIRPARGEHRCQPDPLRVARLRQRLEEVTGLSALFQVLADETRTKILYLLAAEELCVCDLAAVLQMSLPAVSHHLRLLKTARLVRNRREGKNVYYSLADQHVLQLIQVAQDHYREERGPHRKAGRHGHEGESIPSQRTTAGSS